MATTDNFQAAGLSDSETGHEPSKSNGQAERVENQEYVVENINSLRNPELELTCSLKLKAQGAKFTDVGLNGSFERFETVAPAISDSNAAEAVRESTPSVSDSGTSAPGPEQKLESTVGQENTLPEACTYVAFPEQNIACAKEQEKTLPEACCDVDSSVVAVSVNASETVASASTLENKFVSGTDVKGVIEIAADQDEQVAAVDVGGSEVTSKVVDLQKEIEKCVPRFAYEAENNDGNGELASVQVDKSELRCKVSDHDNNFEEGLQGGCENNVTEQSDKAEENVQEGLAEAGNKVTEQRAERAVGVDEESPEMLLAPEVDTVQVLPHWTPKPCARVTSIGGQVTKEELTSLFGAYGQISSISFENERQDTAIVRYDHSAGDPENLITKVRDNLNNTKLGERTLIVEPSRLDSLLFIGNLTADIDDHLLWKMFEPHGTVERAFVLRNTEGRSKGYGFVEYSLRSQATSAKVAMGNINMDGRVLRVEWSDCRRFADLFSSVLFIDRLPRDFPHVEQSLKNLFGQYGKVKDCHLAIGINQQFRGFGFIDFYHSVCADKARIGLDGHNLERFNIRVSFANPSKSAQSYKLRFGTEAAQAALGKGASRGETMQSLVHLGGSMRGHMGLPLLTSRFMGPVRQGMLGMGIGMQFGRGNLDRGLLSGGAGMLGPGSMTVGMTGCSPLMLGSLATQAGMAVGGNILHGGGPRLPDSQGTMPITPAAIVQVATAQAKARAEAAKQNVVKQGYPHQQSQPQPYQRYQQNYQQMAASDDQHYKQSDGTYPHQQTYQQTQQQQSHYHHAWTQATNAHQQYNSSQQYGQQYSQHSSQMDGQTTGQQYQQVTQQHLQTQTIQYSQEQQQQQQEQIQTISIAAAGSAMVSDISQQQAYAAYYKQHAQKAITQSETAAATLAVTAAGTAAAALASATPSTIAAAQQSYEAQWAAYYASQAAYQQASYAHQQSYSGLSGSSSAYNEQASTVDVGQKRTADQMEFASQAQQAAYNYAQAAPATSISVQQAQTGYLQQAVTGYSQQAGTVYTPAMQQSSNATAYQHHPGPTAAFYQQQQQQSVEALSYQQPIVATTGYLQQSTTGLSGYHQPTVPAADSYQQQSATVTGTSVQGQIGVLGFYDLSKRPRY